MNEIITIVDGKVLLYSQLSEKIIAVEKQLKELKNIQDTYKKVIKEAMEEKCIKKIINEVEGINITYTSEQKNLERFNKDKFQEDYPELYDQYVTMDGKKTAFITIKFI